MIRTTILAITATTAAASGAVTYLSQERYAEAKQVWYTSSSGVARDPLTGEFYTVEYPHPLTHTKIEADDFGFFESLPLKTSVSRPNIPLETRPYQRSSLGQSGITMSGAVTTTGGMNERQAGVLHLWPTTDGLSLLDIVFAVDEPTEFELAGEWDVRPPQIFTGRHIVHVELTGDRTIFEYDYDRSTIDDFSEAFGTTGVLQPGEYRLRVNISWTETVGGTPGFPLVYDINLRLAPAPTTLAVLLPTLVVAGRWRR